MANNCRTPIPLRERVFCALRPPIVPLSSPHFEWRRTESTTSASRSRCGRRRQWLIYAQLEYCALLIRQSLLTHFYIGKFTQKKNTCFEGLAKNSGTNMIFKQPTVMPIISWSSDWLSFNAYPKKITFHRPANACTRRGCGGPVWGTGHSRAQGYQLHVCKTCGDSKQRSSVVLNRGLNRT